MAALRAAVEGLGCADVKTLLNSGNVVYRTSVAPAVAAGRIARAIAEQVGVTCAVVALARDELAAILDANPIDADESAAPRLLVTVFDSAAEARRLEPLAREDWTPERFALGERVAYSLHPDGISKGQLPIAMGKLQKGAGTARNLATLTKLRGMLDAMG
jgi:uncharacterized protein (DUF1697 family)